MNTNHPVILDLIRWEKETIWCQHQGQFQFEKIVSNPLHPSKYGCAYLYVHACGCWSNIYYIIFFILKIKCKFQLLLARSTRIVYSLLVSLKNEDHAAALGRGRSSCQNWIFLFSFLFWLVWNTEGEEDLSRPDEDGLAHSISAFGQNLLV